MLLSAQESYDITFEDASSKIGIHASANGIGLMFRNTVPLKGDLSRAIDVTFTGVRNIKEKSILNQRMVNTTPYVYGKVNRLYALRPAFGLEKIIAEKQNKNSVGINVFGVLGPTFGILKPIYVDVEIFDPNSQGMIQTSSVRYDPEIQKPEQITGYSSFGKGFWESRIVGGISLKAGAEFNWGYYSTEYKSIEIGFMVDYFPGRPEIMHFIKNKIVYSSFYLSFAFGKTY